VKQNKTGRNLSEGQAKNTPKSWKEKAQERAKENTRLKKCLKEVSHGRDLWKHKYQNLSIC